MINFLRLDLDEIYDTITYCASVKNISEAIIEKDLWNCYFLDFLFNRSKYRDYFIFKGGTSLSKGFGIIDRYSEDLDIVLDASVLGIDLEHKMKELKTRNQQNKFIDIIDNESMNFIENNIITEIKEICEHDRCGCEHDGIILSSIKHTLKIGFFILIVNLLINLIIFKVGENNLSNLLHHKNILSYFIACLIGLIPNCAGSVIITEVYLAKFITVGTMIGGLLTGSGLGILLLFKTNKNLKENLSILSIIYFTGVLLGFIIDLVI